MFAIDNFEHVLRAYGPDAAESAARHVGRALRNWLGPDATLASREAGRFRGLLADGSHAAQRADHVCAIATLNRAIANPPPVMVKSGCHAIYLSVSGTLAVRPGAHGPTGLAEDVEAIRPFFGQVAGRGAAWAARYRADMAAVSALLGTALGGMAGQCGPELPASPEAMPGEQLVLARQPVRHGGNPEAVLHYELSPLLVARSGARRTLADLRPALDRLGFASAFDRHLIDHAMALLEADPDLALAVPVSPQGICDVAGWNPVMRRLAGNPEAARRLTVAILETASFPDLSGAVQTVSRFQALGCAVAVDNFGLGYTSIRELLTLTPDLICIDPFFMSYRPAAVSEGDALRHLIGLGSALAPAVIVKGVNTEAQSRHALSLGACWQQGDFLGAPALGRIRAGPSPPPPCLLAERPWLRTRKGG